MVEVLGFLVKGVGDWKPLKGEGRSHPSRQQSRMSFPQVYGSHPSQGSWLKIKGWVIPVTGLMVEN